MQTPYFSALKYYYDAGWLGSKILHYSAPVADPSGGSLRFVNPGFTNGPGYYRGGLTQYGSWLNAYLEPAGIFVVDSCPEYPSTDMPTETVLGAEFGAVSVILPIGSNDYLVAGHNGIGRITDGATAWFRAITFPAQLPSVIATDGVNALFVYSQNSSVTIIEYTYTHRYISVPLSGSSGTITYSGLPSYTYTTPAAGGNGNYGGHLAVVAGQMPNFTIGAANFWISSPDGLYTDGMSHLVGPAVLQGDGSYNINGVGWGIYSPPFNMAVGNTTFNVKASGSVVTQYEAFSISVVATKDSMASYFPSAIAGYPNGDSLGAGDVGFGYDAILPPGIFWTNLRNSAELS